MWGSTVPAKFNVTADDVRVTDPAVATVSSTIIACPSDALTDAIEQTVTTASSSLRWDATSQQFIYNWRTPKTQACASNCGSPPVTIRCTLRTSS